MRMGVVGSVVVDPVGITTGTGEVVVAAPAKPNPWLGMLESMEGEILDLLDLEKSPSGPPSGNTPWHTVLTQTHGNFSLQVQKRAHTDFCFRLVSTLETTPEACFDLLSDVTRRVEWDELCEGGGVVEDLGAGMRVQFMRTKGLWPTAPRDALVVALSKRLPEGKGYLNVTRSIESHPGYSSRAGDVRMEAKLAGQLVMPDPEGREHVCKVVQVVDGDLKGWIPKSVLSMVSQHAFPASFKKVNKMLKQGDHRDVSRCIEEAEGKRAASTTVTAASSTTTTDSATSSTTSTALTSPSPLTSIVGPTAAQQLEALKKLLPMLLPILSKTGKGLRVAQPWLVAFIFLSVVFGRRRR
ncbi:hypothetical protein HK102_001648 [Quaeritorhiza haematococci]|nr:hypothetical protein HK102_001648 [Quaeritorhiza haematococci]